MKKNLRIVSAAAAALLAVAPVAATSVSTVLADMAVTVAGGADQSTTNKATLNLSVTNANALADGDSSSKATASLATPALPTGATVTVSQARLYAKADVTSVTDGAVTFAGTNTADSNAKSVTKGTTYVAIAYVTITGLKANTQYVVNNSSANAASAKSDNTGTIANFAVMSDEFTIADPGLVGSPYVKDAKDTTNKVLTSGSYDLTSADYSVKKLAKALVNTAASGATPNGKYEAAVTAPDATTANNASAKFVNPEADVRAALKAAGITTKGTDETFDKPAAPFVVTLNVVATNGKTTAFPVTVDPNSATADLTFPKFTYYTKGTTAAEIHNVPTVGQSANNTLDSIDNLVDSANKEITFNYVPVNGVVDTATIKKAFSAVVNGNGNNDVLPVDVDASKVNTKVAGKYPVVVSATNADKKTSKITFMLTVGAKGATYKTVQSDGDIPVYKIEGNTVTDSKTTVKNGDQIAVFGDPIKIGDKSYTRINSADSNLYVETKYVDGSFKPADKTSKTVMHNAYIYDKDHKRVGTKTLAAYTKVDVLGAATKLADGSLVYQIGDNQYVMADNIDGTVRTLSHNAYVYKTSKKRADRRVLRKGAKVTTYGSPYTFKNGKSYYRIGGPAKQYVKVANFN